MSYYPEPNSHRKIKIKVELSFSNHAKKIEVKKARGVATPKLAKKVDLVKRKFEVD